jgi:hypothetical protein
MEKELFTIETWVVFHKPGLKDEVMKLGEACKDKLEFRDKLRERYHIDASIAFTISNKFYKQK